MSDYDSAVPGEDADLAKFRRWFREDSDAAIEWRKEAEIDYAFYAGHGQWEELDRQRLKDQQRPCVTFNRVAPVVSAVVGQEINQRAEVTYKPRTTQTPEEPQPGMPAQATPGADDSGPAETITAAAAYLRDQCDAEDEESDAFQDAVICGMGWVETRVDFDENPDGDLREDRIDPLEMVWDCKALKRNLADMRRVFRVREIDVDEAKAMFPGKDISVLDASWARMDKTTQPHDREAARFYASERDGDFDPSRHTVTMVECQYYETKAAYRSVNIQDGQPVEFPDKKQADNYSKNVFTMAGIHVPVSKQMKRVYKTAVIGKEVLSDDESQAQECFKYQAMTGFRDRNKKQWVGLVRAMRDPQRWANSLFSSVLHQIQTTGKGIMAERSAFEDDKRAEQDWANGSRIVWLKTGAIAGQQIQQKEQHALPQGVFDMMQLSLGAFRDVTGVNIESMGLADRQQAASLEFQRTKQAGIILAPLFDGLRRFRKENGRLILDLIKNYLSDGRLVRVVGPDYEKYVPLIQQDDTVEYDIIVDESPSSPNQKEASWAILQQLLPVIGKSLTPSTGAILMKASPLPETVLNEFKKAAEKEAQNAGPSPEMMQMQMQQEEHQHDMQMTAQKGQIDLQKAQVDAEKSQVDLQLKQMELALKQQEIELAKFQAQVDVQMKTTELGFKQQEMQAKAQDGEVQRRHDMQMRKMEIGGQVDTEMAKNPELMGSLTTNISKGLETVAQALLQSNQALAQSLQQMAQGQMQLAEAVTMPKTVQMSEDGMTGMVRPVIQ